MSQSLPHPYDALARVRLARAHARRALRVLEPLSGDRDGLPPRLAVACRSAADLQRAVLLELQWALELLSRDPTVGPHAAREVQRSRRS